MSETMHEPLSWLLLERYALDELTPEERTRVEARLAESAVDRACLDNILHDDTELPPLPLPAPIELAAHASKRRSAWRYASSALAIAAALALFVRPDALPPSRRVVYDGAKGGELSLLLASERAGEDAVQFAQGERFKLLVTCPDWLAAQLRVVVFQAGERYEPLPQVPDFACGNHVAWPGAFALDGAAPADVCVSFGGAGPLETARSPSELEPKVVCKRLTPRVP